MSNGDKKLTDAERRELTTYVVEKDFGKKSDVYRITKMVIGVEVDSYHCTVKLRNGQLHDKDIWCDCPGFRRQNFAKIEHKHIMLVLNYMERGEPTSATYTIVGTGKNAKIRYMSFTNVPE